LKTLRGVYIVFALVIGIPSARADIFGDVTSVEVRDSCVILRTGTSALMITPWSRTIVKMSLFPDGAVHGDSSFVIVQPREHVSWNWQQTDTSVDIETIIPCIHVSKHPLRVHYFPQSVGLEDENGFYWNGNERGVRLRLRSDEPIYGGGERANGLNHRGQVLESYNQIHYCYGDGEPNLNITIPFLLSPFGWGIYLDNTYPAQFDIAATTPNVLDCRTSGGDAVFYVLTGDSVFNTPYMFPRLTGFAPLPPRWAFGYLQSRFGYHSETEARVIVSEFRNRHIPLDALILDLYWFGWGGMGNLNWDYSQWPNPSGMMHDFDSLGVKTILITEPYIQQTSSNYGAAYTGGHLTPDSNGIPVLLPNFWAGAASLVDITRPETRDWFWQFYAARVNEGVGGWWSDLGEPELHPDNMRHYLGPAAKVHNIYSLLWAKVLYDKYREQFPQQRVFNLIRSGFAGMQRYGAIPWSGDVQRTFSGLRAQVPIMLNMGLSGVPFVAYDIGGFDCGPQDPELYIREMQLGCFMPIMRSHGVTVPPEPFYYDSTTARIATDYIRLRYAMLPYTYHLAYIAARVGRPMASPLFTYYRPSDPLTFNIDDEFFWGSFLVAPVLDAGARSRNVYLPAGTWIDYWTDDLYLGPQTITASAPLDRIPLFVSDGAIIPMMPVRESARLCRADTLLFHGWPRWRSGSYGSYFWDNGTATVWHGEWNDVSLVDDNAAITFQISRSVQNFPEAVPVRRIQLEIHRMAAAPTAVLVGTHSVPQVLTRAAAESLDSAYYFDTAQHRVVITFHHAHENLPVVLQGAHILGASENRISLPRQFALHPCYPNPFNGQTRVSFDLPRASLVKLDVFNMLGQRVATLADTSFPAGKHELSWNAAALPSGVYVLRLQAGTVVRQQKALLLK
jgi:oligosaccharide 4-alpha-D-glucosyltransferase